MILNLTPHPITLLRGDGEENRQVLLPAGKPARVASCQTSVGEFDGMPLVRQEYGEVQDLPPIAKDTIFIVSRMVMVACPHRSDLVCPADLVRDTQGNIVGCRSLERL